MITSFKQLKAMLFEHLEISRIGVVAAQDEHTLDAVVMAAKDGLVWPVLLGDASLIKQLLAKFECSEDIVEIIDIPSPEECALKAAEMVRSGKLDCIMKGKIQTGAIMKILVNKEHGIRKSDTMSLLAFIESPYYKKILGITDVGLLTYPNLEQKKGMIENAKEAFTALGVQNPKIAVLAAVETVNPKMLETIDADELKRMNREGIITDCIVEGPISYDLAVDKSAAQVKGYESPVSGDVDLLVVPNIVAGNLLVKGLICTGGAKTAGIVMGAMVPLVITSRSATVEDKYMSIVLSALVGSKKGDIK